MKGFLWLALGRLVLAALVVGCAVSCVAAMVEGDWIAAWCRGALGYWLHTSIDVEGGTASFAGPTTAGDAIREIGRREREAAARRSPRKD